MGESSVGMSTPAAPILRLIRIGFDSLENRSPRYEETVGLFIGEKDGVSAARRIEDWKARYIAKWPSFRGYDREIYPQWRVVEDPLL